MAVFFVAFLVDELSAMKDSGVSLYAQDFWSWMDMGLIVRLSYGGDLESRSLSMTRPAKTWGAGYRSCFSDNT